MEFLTLRPDAARSGVTSDVATVGDWVFIAGQGPIDLDDDRTPLPEMVEAQTLKVLANAETLLRRVGLARGHLVSVRVFIVNFPRFAERVNEAYREFFAGGRLPVRTCVGVSHLTRGALVEMDFVAHRG